MAVLAPAAAIQAGFDVPRGMIDKSIESRVAGIPKKKRKSSLRTGIGRGAGRLSAALVTTPMFLSGIKQLKNAKTKKDQNEGLIKVVGSGAVYSGIKGGVEGGITEGFNRKALSKIKDLATIRGGLGMGAAALTGLGIASLKKQESKLKKKGIKKSKSSKMLDAAATGLGIGALKGGIEGLYLNRKNIKPYLKTPRKLVGVMAGRGVAGAAGATLLSEIADKYMSKVSGVNTTTYSKLPLGPETILDGISRPTTLSDDRLRALVKDLQKHEEKDYRVRGILYRSLDEMERRELKDTPKSSTRDKVTEKGFKKDALIGLSPAILGPLHVAESKMSNKEMTPKEKKDYSKIKNYIKRQGFPIEDFSMHPALAERPDLGLYDVGNEKIYAGGKAPGETALHEFGHGKSYKNIKGVNKRLLGARVSNLLFSGGSMLSAAGPILAFNYENLTEKEIREVKRTAAITGVAGLGLNAPLLLEEAIANKNAIKAIKNISKETGESALPKILKYIRKLALPQATYYIPTLTAAAGYAILSSREKKLKRKLNKEAQNESRK